MDIAWSQRSHHFCFHCRVVSVEFCREQGLVVDVGRRRQIFRRRTSNDAAVDLKNVVTKLSGGGYDIVSPPPTY